jgi:predicted acetyltransferase
MSALSVGFLRAPTVADEEVEIRRAGLDLDRTQGAFDAGRCVATFRSMPRELTVPGGALVAADAITNVSVSATHRRRGIASRMMADDLTAAKERGDALAILIAAEYPIYGRFGFGPATAITEWEIEVARATKSAPAVAEPGRLELITPAEALKLGPELHDRFRRRTPGAINRPDRWWELATGTVRMPSEDWKEPLFVLHRDASTGRPDGLATYRVEEKWHGMLSNCPLSVSHLIAATPTAERALWRYLLSVDWVTTVHTGFRAPDDILPALLTDPRAARVSHSTDFMWLRILDTPRALSARTYATPGTLVLAITDPHGHASGTFRLEASTDGTATCALTDTVPDLTLTAADLATLYLGDASAVRLAALGNLTEHHPDAAARTDALFRTPRRPWCPDIF